MTARRVVLVTGLSGAGRNTILHMLEDDGSEAVDLHPLARSGRVADGIAAERALTAPCARPPIS